MIQSLAGIEKPTLVLVGEHDEPFLGSTDYIHHKVVGSTKAVIANAGHAANIDNPAEFNRVVLDFLATLP